MADERPRYGELPVIFGELDRLHAQAAARHPVSSIPGSLAQATAELKLAYQAAIEMELGADSFDNTEVSRRFSRVQECLFEALQDLREAYGALLA